MGIKKEKALKVFEKYEELLRFERDRFETDITNQRDILRNAQDTSEVIMRYNLIEDLIRAHGVRVDIVIKNMFKELDEINDKTKGINYNPR